MKKLIALIGMAGLMAVGCAHRDQNRGGTYDSTDMKTGTTSSDSTIKSSGSEDKTNNSGNRSSATDTTPSSTDTSNSKIPQK